MALKVLSMGAKAKPHFSSLPISSQAKILTDDDDEKNNETVSLILAPY